MTDEHKLHAARNRAMHAKALLDNELLNEAFATRRTDLINAWINSQPRDTEGRERLWSAMQELERLKISLQSIVADGSVATRELLDKA